MRGPRVIAKQDRKGWGVYDRERASWPIQVPGFGRVAQDLRSQEEAETEAQRLEDFYTDR
jgi:hypothetical protein